MKSVIYYKETSTGHEVDPAYSKQMERVAIAYVKYDTADVAVSDAIDHYGYASNEVDAAFAKKDHRAEMLTKKWNVAHKTNYTAESFVLSECLTQACFTAQAHGLIIITQ